MKCIIKKRKYFVIIESIIWIHLFDVDLLFLKTKSVLLYNLYYFDIFSLYFKVNFLNLNLKFVCLIKVEFLLSLDLKKRKERNLRINLIHRLKRRVFKPVQAYADKIV